MALVNTDYKDDVFTGDRKYRMIDNGDGTVSFQDVTQYTQVGDSFGASLLNRQNEILNWDEPMTLAEYNAIVNKENRLYFCYNTEN